MYLGEVGKAVLRCHLTSMCECFEIVSLADFFTGLCFFFFFLSLSFLFIFFSFVCFQFQPLVTPRAACGFVGLRNASATCYMNAVLQQFYMQPGIKEVTLLICSWWYCCCCCCCLFVCLSVYVIVVLLYNCDWRQYCCVSLLIIVIVWMQKWNCVCVSRLSWLSMIQIWRKTGKNSMTTTIYFFLSDSTSTILFFLCSFHSSLAGKKCFFYQVNIMIKS